MEELGAFPQWCHPVLSCGIHTTAKPLIGDDPNIQQGYFKGANSMLNFKVYSPVFFLLEMLVMLVNGDSAWVDCKKFEFLPVLSDGDA